jgi:hypothetical protein
VQPFGALMFLMYSVIWLFTSLWRDVRQRSRATVPVRPPTD